MSDLISRQAAIGRAVELPLFGKQVKVVAVSELEALPPAQPEIIWCKDCKHWDGVDTCDVIDAPVWDNDFCSMAERRSNE